MGECVGGNDRLEFQGAGMTELHRQGDRRLKATLVVLTVWAIVSLLHWQPMTQWGMLCFTAILTLQTARILLSHPIAPKMPSDSPLPTVAILIPAKNEQAVLPDLVSSLVRLDYPASHLDLWIVDDGSTDATPDCLRQLQQKFPRLQIHRRHSQGGKAGALNAVLPLSQGEIILVCDADAQLPANFLRQTVPLFQPAEVGAIQVRKAIANASDNFLTRCQQMEMDGDSWLQIHRIAAAGMSELRGNGMLVRRSRLEQCNGWSEDTVTDDLDLTFKLYLAGAEIAFLTQPVVQEEGVTTWKALWHQRCRWAEGGYQRYLDYFPQTLRLPWGKQLDLLLFFVLQFLLPLGLLADLMWVLVRGDRPVLLPLQILLSLLLTLAFLGGLYHHQRLRGVGLLWATLQGSLYMAHWIPVMIVITLRLCLQKQSCQWIKTEHRGRMA